MYESVSEFLRDASAGNPFLWALLVMAVVSVTGVALFLFWEGFFRLVSFVSHFRDYWRKGSGRA